MTDLVADVADLLARRVGLRLDPAARGRLARAVRDEAGRRGEDEASYVSGLHRDGTVLQDLLDRVTVQETSFFRDPAQFRALTDEVLPPLAASQTPVQVWSAGCANGQEPYSIAMALAESGLRDWSVVATDISTRAVARTRAGRYAEREMGGVSPGRRARHFVQVGDTDGFWEVAPGLRSRVDVRRHNLAADPPPVDPGRCPIVFCRNVLIYFGRDELLAFLRRLSEWLPSDALLFLGYSESLWLVSDLFHLVRLGEAFAYRNGPAVKTSPPVLAGVAEPGRARSPQPVRRPPVPSPSPPTPVTPPDPVPRPRSGADANALLADGEAAMGAGDHAQAVTAFRKATFVDPDQPLTHLSLGLALEAMNDHPAARRAYAAARSAIARGDASTIEATLEGYGLPELTRLLDRKTAPS